MSESNAKDFKNILDRDNASTHSNETVVDAADFDPSSPLDAVNTRPRVVHLENTCSTPNVLHTFNNMDGAREYESNKQSQLQPLTYIIKEQNIKSWNVKFSGEGSVDDFLLRVNESMQAYNVHETVLLRCFCELLSGDALKFYRLIRDQVQSWSELQNQFKDFFNAVDSNYILERKIRELKQNPGQPIALYILELRSMNQKLSNPISDVALLEIAKHNILPTYAQVLAVNKIENFNSLLTITKHYEAYAGCSSDAPNVGNKQSFKSNTFRKTTNVPTCMKCKKVGHHHSVCRTIPGPICFRCGLKGTTARTCEKCNRPNKGHRSQNNNNSKNYNKSKNA